MLWSVVLQKEQFLRLIEAASSLVQIALFPTQLNRFVIRADHPLLYIQSYGSENGDKHHCQDKHLLQSAKKKLN